MYLNESPSAEDRALILKIADRAMADGPAPYTDKIRAVMDLCIVHCNGCALDLAAFLSASETNFWHDINGIAANLDRVTGQLKNVFTPRHARQAAPIIFKTLTNTEEADYRQWARDNYTPGTPINPLWHPSVRDEAEKINAAQPPAPKYNRFKVATDLLDAGNMRAIAREFVRIVDDAAADLKATTQVWEDPAVVIVITKLAELSGAHRPDAFSNAFAAARQRAS